MRSADQVVEDLERYTPNADDWRGLDGIIDDACQFSGFSIVRALLGVLERNPDHDGNGVFWSVIHALEAIGGYETELVKSISRQPHELSVLMLNRLINSGAHDIDGTPIISILESIVSNESFSDDIRDEANDFVKYQQNRI